MDKELGKPHRVVDDDKMLHLHPARCLPVLLLVAPCLTGCMYLEGTLGYYSVKAAQGDAAGSQAVAEPKGGVGFGIGMGGVIDVAHKTVRVAAGASYDSVPTDNDKQEGSAAALAGDLRLDISVMKLSDSMKLRGTAGYVGGKSTIKGYGDVDASMNSFYVGPTLWFGNDDDVTAFMATAGLRYMKFAPKAANTSVGNVTATGPELRLAIDFDASSSSSGGGGGGGSSGVVHLSVTMDDSTNLIPALANGARRAGCDVNEKSDGVIAKCSSGNIVYLQSGRQLDILCQDGLSTEQCKALNSNILDHAK